MENTFSMIGNEEVLCKTAVISSGNAEYRIRLEHDYRIICKDILSVSRNKDGKTDEKTVQNRMIGEGQTLTLEQIRHPSVRLASAMRFLSSPYRSATTGESPYRCVDVTVPIKKEIVAKLVFEADRLLDD